MTPHIIAYCLDWHINQSKAFNELLVDPLKPFIDLELIAWDGRSGDPLGNWVERALVEPVVFCQRPPTPELLKIPGARLVWVPMWDNVALNWSSDEWWASLPKTLRVVAFSSGIEQKAKNAGLPTLRLCYYKNPLEFREASWENGRVLFYWNRTGLFGPTFMKNLCAVLNIRTLYFRGMVDPKISPKAAYELPSKMGRTTVHKVSRFDTQKQYFELLRRCNIYLAPRALEGVGLTFLEAMASGCAVMGYDAPTMNEYITHSVDGYLFPAQSLKQSETSIVQHIKDAIQMWMTGKSTVYPQTMSDHQDWSQLEGIDLEMLGCIARSKQEVGFALWEKQILEYAHFILDW